MISTRSIVAVPTVWSSPTWLLSTLLDPYRFWRNFNHRERYAATSIGYDGVHVVLILACPDGLVESYTPSLDPHGPCHFRKKCTSHELLLQPISG